MKIIRTLMGAGLALALSGCFWKSPAPLFSTADLSPIQISGAYSFTDGSGRTGARLVAAGNRRWTLYTTDASGRERIKATGGLVEIGSDDMGAGSTYYLGEFQPGQTEGAAPESYHYYIIKRANPGDELESYPTNCNSMAVRLARTVDGADCIFDNKQSLLAAARATVEMMKDSPLLLIPESKLSRY